ncbi:MAG: hypothetical protein JWN34_3991 [Bryobacterales bacterium]|nr:hypothetical protein [Bryobacterales bacterium]
MKTFSTIAVTLLSLSSLCLAATVAGSPVSAKPGSDKRAFSIGWKFSVSATVNVTGLAWLDPTGAGLAEPHRVGIFDAATGAVLVSTTVAAGTSVPYQDGFRFSAVSFTLRPGTYVVGGLRPSNADVAMVGATSVQTVPQITYLEERELETTDFVMPSVNFAPVEAGSFGPSFMVAETPAGTKSITAVLNSGSFRPEAAAGTYLSVFGTNLSATTRSWTASDFGGGVRLPVSLDGVSVDVNGIPAYVQYVSPGQLNIIVPDTFAADAGISLVVRYPGQRSVTAWLKLQTAAPAFFLWNTTTADNAKYAVAQHADFTNVGKTGLFPQQPARFTTPAKPGETIVLYGTGFGPTSPVLAGGVIADKAYPLSPLPAATVGGRVAAVGYAGLVPSLSSVYQVNLTIPADLPDGDWPVVVNVGGNLSTAALVTVAR